MDLQVKILFFVFVVVSVLPALALAEGTIFDSVLPSRRLHTNFRTIEPGCSKLQNDSNASESAKFQCDPPNFLEDSDLSPYEFAKITEKAVLDCSKRSYQILTANLTFQVIKDLKANYSGTCEILLQSPRSMIFKIYAESKSNNPLHLRHYKVDLFNQFLEEKGSIASLDDIVQSGYFYYSSTSYVTVEIPKVSIGNIEFTIRFEAVPGCTNQLQVFCTTDNLGYVQTPWWNGVSNLYPKHLESCVTLIIPDDHVIMLSVISLELETTNYCSYDRLILYRGPNCTGSKEKICQITDLNPTVYDDTEALSFYFTSDGSLQKTGFRLLYTFHPRSSAPEQLPDGKWNCSVPFYPSFKQHFMCSTVTFCAEGQDKIGCRTAALCIEDLVELENDCYRFFEPNEEITWNEAAQTCQSIRAHLLDLNSAEEWDNFTNFRAVQKDLFVGLKMVSPTAPEMYQFTWTWSDDTLVIYGNISFNRSAEGRYCDVSSNQYCGLIRKENNQSVFLISCDQRIAGMSFVCEIEDLSKEDKIISVQLPVPLNQTLQPMMSRCFWNHTTHSFLACGVLTNCSATDQAASIMCSDTQFFPAVPFFTCRSRIQRVPYTLVCDFRVDCCDSSDEDFCQFLSCVPGKEFSCGNKKQCIPREQHCDGLQQCVDGSDELQCRDILTSQDIVANTVKPPALVTFTGLGYFNVSQLNSSTCPETHFRCPNGGYCLPVYVRCNDVFDCPGHEDETDCDNFICPGFFRCRKSKICVHNDHLCDNIAQCPFHDDELMCKFKCPRSCICYGYAFICSGVFSANLYTKLRYLEASGTGMTLANVSENRLLIYLGLKKCGITELGSFNLPNLQKLDLSYNKISFITSNTFSQLNNLQFLSLAYNSLLSLTQIVSSEYDFPPLKALNLAGLDIQQIDSTFSSTFPNLISLNLSGTGLTTLSEVSFQYFKQIANLDLRNCPLKTFPPLVFRGILSLSVIYTDNYKMCCPSMLPPGFNPDNCHAPTDELSSCDALLRSEVFRAFLALYALLSLVGNLGSFVYHVVFERSINKMGYHVFVTHLCVADFLMGIYLAIIGVADRLYYGNYSWKYKEWTNSVACKVAGFLSLVSSEMSSFIICAITLERFLVISFPHKNLRFRRWTAHLLCCNFWLLGLLLATVPLLPSTAHWEFYSQSGICIPLPITRNEFAGGDYSFGILICFNFVLFVLIAVGQFLIYWSISSNSISALDSSQKSRDMAVARRLLAIVMTNFLCWFPIGLLGILAKSGVPVPGEVNVAMAIFVLPFNSALNPFLYTFNILVERMRKKRQIKEERNKVRPPTSSSMLSVIDRDKQIGKLYTEDEAWQFFNQVLVEGVLSAERVRRRVIDMDPASK